MNKTSEKIDFVVTYLDSTDKKWQEERAKYSGEKLDSRNSEARYRNMDNFQHWFRSVERYAPWVHKIHIVTWGHVPEWLDTINPKINIVKHDEYIPEKYLPTFNSNVLDLNLDRIEGLSEKFVYFNDDMFLNSDTKPSDFFKNGLPTYQFAYTPVLPIDKFNTVIFNNTFLLNQLNFERKLLPKKSMSLKNGLRAVLLNLYFAPLVLGLKKYIGFYPSHMPYPVTKMAFKQLRTNFSESFDEVSTKKFRTSEDISIWLVADYLKATNQFYPQNLKKFGKYQLLNEKANFFEIFNSKYKIVCINDTESDSNFEKSKELLNIALNEKFPEKSCFER